MTSNRVTRRKIVIIGAGPGGLCMGIKLKEAGFDDFTILEQSGGVGGTWRHNFYPGCEVDVPSALFSFTFERKPDWSRPFARQPELQGYLEMCADKYGLLPHLVLNTAVRSAVWSDDENLWRIESEDGRRFEADVMVSAVGMFNEPHWPDIPGLADFEGHAFHSARWDHTLDLEGRVVAVIGSEVLTTPIDHITKDGIVYEDGIRRNVDTLIFATGFETTN